MNIDIYNTNNKYGIIYTDPPWNVKKILRKCRPNQKENLDYPTMSIEDIKNTHDYVFNNLCENKHNVFMWSTDRYLRQCEDMMNELSYKVHTRFVWDKENGIASAFTVRFSHEYLIWFFKKGCIIRPCKEMQGKYATVIREKSTYHSHKPKFVYDMLNNMFPDIPKLELFARNTHAGFDCWGDEMKVDN